MATSDRKFWTQQQGAAKFKHHVLKNQLGAFAGMAGSTSEAGRVVFLDGYAGPGAYDDGAPGSPALAMEVAQDLSNIRQLRGHFIELKRSQAIKLRRLVEESGLDRWKVHEGPCEDHLDFVLQDAAEDPLLVFLDPYGLAIPLDLLRGLVLGRPRQSGRSVARKTEVILNFSLAAMTRLAGFLDKNYRVAHSLLDEETHASLRRGRTVKQLEQQRDQIIQKLDAFLGGSWWHVIKRADEPGWQKRILDQWLLLATKGLSGWTTVPVEVPDVWNGPAAFYLVLFTRSPHGVHKFNEGVSTAYQHMFEATYSDPGDADRLFALEETKPPDYGPTIIDELVEHLRVAIPAGLHGRVLDHMIEVYGPLIGRARSTHLRAALKELAGDVIAGPVPEARKLLQFEITPLR